MLKLKKVAVTGGVASGKSTVCRLLKSLGAFVIDADKIVHALLSPKTSLGQEIIRLLGPEIVDQDKFNRAVIAAKVFCDDQLLHQLENLLHPEVQKKIEAAYNELSDTSLYSLFVAEIPLLYESKMDEFYDVVCFVDVDEAIAMKRSSLSPEEFKARQKRFLPREMKLNKAHYVISNNNGNESLERQVRSLYNQLIHER